MSHRRDDAVSRQVAVDVPSEQTVLERPARIKDPLEPFADEELVLLFELGVVPLVPAFARCLEPAAKVLVQVGGLVLGAWGGGWHRCQSGISIRSSAVLKAFPVTS